MSAKHIALISFALEGGGAERVLTEMAGHFASLGRRVSLLTLDGTCVDAYPLHSAVNRVRINILWPSRHIWNSVISTLQRQALIRRTVCALKADVVVSFTELTNVRVLAALLGTGIPVIVSERTTPAEYPVGRFWTIARRLAYPFADAVVVQTENVARWARRWLRASRVVVIPNSVRKVTSTGPEPRPAGMPVGPVIVAMGRIAPEKGFDMLVRAFASATSERKEWRLVVLGDGPDRAGLEELAGSLGVAGRVLFPGHQANPVAWLQHAALFVLSSRFEGFPNALLEAMQWGLPAVAFDCSNGPSEIVRHGVDGLLVPAGDVPSMAAAISRLAGDAELRARLAKRAREVADRFPPGRIYGSWLAMCDRLASGAGRVR